MHNPLAQQHAQAARPCQCRAPLLACWAPRAQPSTQPAPVPWDPNGRIVAWLPSLVAIQPSLSSLQYTICIATQFQPNQPPQSRYKFCIMTLPSQPTACNTIFVLQHTSNNPCNTIPVAIQFCIATQPSLFLQYNPAF